MIPQITLKTASGVRTRVDFITKLDNLIEIFEGKASQTAQLTAAQKKAFPEIKKTGAVVVGKGKPGMTGGTVIPPTPVQIKRPVP